MIGQPAWSVFRYLTYCFTAQKRTDKNKCDAAFAHDLLPLPLGIYFTPGGGTTYRGCVAPAPRATIIRMNKKMWLCAVGGVLLGAAVVQTAHVISDRNSRELFGQRLRCKALADKYVRDRSADGGMVDLSRVEFSRRRGSCIASTSEKLGLDVVTAAQLGIVQKPSDDIYSLNVVDLLTGEDLVTRTCTGRGSDNCAKSMEKRDEGFEEVR